jgi:hypothetical protein
LNFNRPKGQIPPGKICIHPHRETRDFFQEARRLEGQRNLESFIQKLIKERGKKTGEEFVEELAEKFFQEQGRRKE